MSRISAGKDKSASIFTSSKSDAFKKEGVTLNFAFRNVDERSFLCFLKKHDGKSVKTLDLTSNNLSELSSFYIFETLETLVLDHNQINCNTIFPSLPNLTMLSLNSNMIVNLSLFIRNLATSLPGLRYLSLMKNEAAPSYFNGGTVEQFQDYRLFIASHFSNLEVLDDRKITDEERHKAYSIYGRRWKLKKGRRKSRLKAGTEQSQS